MNISKEIDSILDFADFLENHDFKNYLPLSSMLKLKSLIFECCLDLDYLNNIEITNLKNYLISDLQENCFESSKKYLIDNFCTLDNVSDFYKKLRNSRSKYNSLQEHLQNQPEYDIIFQNRQNIEEDEEVDEYDPDFDDRYMEQLDDENNNNIILENSIPSVVDSWTDNDCRIFLNEIGIPLSLINNIEYDDENNEYIYDDLSLSEIIKNLYHEYLQKRKNTLNSDIFPKISEEQRSRIFLAFEFIFCGLGIIKILPNWLQEQRQLPLIERNLISLTSGNKQLKTWYEQKYNYIMSNGEGNIDISDVINRHMLTGCQLYFKDGYILNRVARVFNTEVFDLCNDLFNHINFLQDPEYDDDNNDRNLIYFDKFSNIEQSFDTLIGYSYQDADYNDSNFDKLNTLIHEIYNFINEQNDDIDNSDLTIIDYKRLLRNLPPIQECVFEILKQDPCFYFLNQYQHNRYPRDNMKLDYSDLCENFKIPEMIKFFNFEFIVYNYDVEKLIEMLKSIYENTKFKFKLNIINTSRNKLDINILSQVSSNIEGLTFKNIKNKFELSLKELQDLDNLKYLNLDMVHIIFDVDIGKLSNLTDLSLSNFKLTNIDGGIGNLKNLQHLKLKSFDNKDLFEEFGQLSNLTTLKIRSISINVFPEVIFSLTNLTNLSLTYTEIKTIPSKIYYLEKLQKLKLNNNKLEFLPTEIGTLTRLTDLNLNHNKLEFLPTEMFRLRNLRNLNLANNNLTELPDNIVNLINLKKLDISWNKIIDIPKGLEDSKVEIENIRIHG